jgi:hypothetical protein
MVVGGEAKPDLSSIGDEDLTREYYRRIDEGRRATERSEQLAREMRAAGYAEEDKAKAAAIGITPEQLWEAMEWGVEAHETRY